MPVPDVLQTDTPPFRQHAAPYGDSHLRIEALMRAMEHARYCGIVVESTPATVIATAEKFYDFLIGK